MSIIPELKEKRAQAVAFARNIVKDNPKLEGDLQRQFDEALTQGDDFGKQIELEERKEKLEKAENELKVITPENRSSRSRVNSFSLDPVAREQTEFSNWFMRQCKVEGYDNAGEDSQYFNPYAKSLRFALDLNEGNRPWEKRTGLVTTSSAAGGALIPTLVPAAIVHFLKYFCPLINYVRNERTPNGNPIHWPTVDASSQQATIVAEQQAAPETDPVFSFIPLIQTPLWRGKVLISKELLMNAVVDLVPLVSKLIAEEVGRGWDEAFVTGTDSLGGAVSQGLKPAALTGTQTGGAVSSLSFDPLINMRYQVDRAYEPNGAYFMSNSTVGALRTVKDGQGRYQWFDYLDPMKDDGVESINGHKIVVTNQLSNFADSGHNVFAIYCQPDLFMIRQVGELVISVNPFRYEELGQIAVFFEVFADSVYLGPPRSITYIST